MSRINHPQRGMAVSSILLLLVMASVMLTAVIRPNIIGMKQRSSIEREGSVEDSLRTLAKNIVDNSKVLTITGTNDFVVVPPHAKRIASTVNTSPTANQSGISIPNGTAPDALIQSVGNLDKNLVRYCGYNIVVTNDATPQTTLTASLPKLTTPQLTTLIENSDITRVFGAQNLNSTPVFELFYGTAEALQSAQINKCNANTTPNPAALRQHGVIYIPITLERARMLRTSQTVEVVDMPALCELGEVLSVGALPIAEGATTPEIGLDCKPVLANYALDTRPRNPETRETEGEIETCQHGMITASEGASGIQCAPKTVRNLEAYVTANVNGVVRALYNSFDYLQPDLNVVNHTTTNLPQAPANLSCDPPSIVDNAYTAGGALVFQTGGRVTCVDISLLGVIRGEREEPQPLCGTNQKLVWMPGSPTGYKFGCTAKAERDQEFVEPIIACDKEQVYNLSGYSPETNSLICTFYDPPTTSFNQGFTYLADAIDGVCADDSLVGTDGGNRVRCTQLGQSLSRFLEGPMTYTWVTLWLELNNNEETSGNYTLIPPTDSLRWAMNWNPTTKKLVPVYPSLVIRDMGDGKKPKTGCENDSLVGEVSGEDIVEGISADSENGKDKKCTDYLSSDKVAACRDKYQNMIVPDYAGYLANMRDCTGDRNYIEPAQSMLLACEAAYGDVKYTSTSLYIDNMRDCTRNYQFTLAEQNLFDQCITDTVNGRYFYSVLNYRDTVQACVDIAANRIPATPDPMLNNANNSNPPAETCSPTQTPYEYNDNGTIKTGCVETPDITRLCSTVDNSPILELIGQSHDRLASALAGKAYGYPYSGQNLDFSVYGWCANHYTHFTQIASRCESAMRDGTSTVIGFEDGLECMTEDQIRERCISSANNISAASFADQNSNLKNAEDAAQECMMSPQIWFGMNEMVYLTRNWDYLYR